MRLKVPSIIAGFLARRKAKAQVLIKAKAKRRDFRSARPVLPEESIALARKFKTGKATFYCSRSGTLFYAKREEVPFRGEEFYRTIVWRQNPKTKKFEKFAYGVFDVNENHIYIHETSFVNKHLRILNIGTGSVLLGPKKQATGQDVFRIVLDEALQLRRGLQEEDGRDRKITIDVSASNNKIVKHYKRFGFNFKFDGLVWAGTLDLTKYREEQRRKTP